MDTTIEKHVFGPVHSRRLGRSLGIDPVPMKTCNWNCVYCQLGRSQQMVNKRKAFFDPQRVLSQVRDALEAHKPGHIDWVTFVGSGETCLALELGQMIRGVKAITDLPVAVITNGSLLKMQDVREALLPADAVLPSLDAGNQVLYRRINRPHPDFTFDGLVEGLIRFREEFTHKLWVEVMLIKGMNDTEEALKEIAEILAKINPDEVHVVTPSRPPVELWVQAADEEGLLRARAILGRVAKIIHPLTCAFELKGSENLLDAILGIIVRHPMRVSELEEALEAWSADEIRQTLYDLAHTGRAKIVERHGVRFWHASEANFPNHE